MEQQRNGGTVRMCRRSGKHPSFKYKVGMRVLVLDIGGTHVKVYATGHRKPVKIVSGAAMTPKKMLKDVLALIDGWRYDVVSIGYPGPVVRGRPLRDPVNLGAGWVGFDFQKAFGCRVKIINDAAMQALGSYRGGSMLFLGFGTGGTANGKNERGAAGIHQHRALCDIIRIKCVEPAGRVAKSYVERLSLRSTASAECQLGLRRRAVHPG